MEINIIEKKKLQTISTMIKSKNESVRKRGYRLLDRLVNTKCRENKNSSIEEFYNIFRR